MQLDHRSIMSGQRKTLGAVLLRGGLWLASVPYRLAVAIRNRRYDQGKLPVHHCDVPVISIGNLTTGGTGKTPVVCKLAGWFRQRGIRVAIVSRGYGRQQQGDSNDEAMELHARLPDVPHVQDPDRVAAVAVAVQELESQVILMDDGFQHRRLHRDLEIVVIDATCPFGYDYLLPRGLLREPVENLSRADLVLLSRCQSVTEETLEAIQTRISQANASVPIVRCDHQTRAILEHPDRIRPVEELAGKDVAVVSAIGNPEAFEQTVKESGANLVDAQRLPDHDPYAPNTVERLQQWIRSLETRISCVVCTHKDLVKLRTDRLGGRRLVAMVIELTFLDEDHAINTLLESKILPGIKVDGAGDASAQ